MAKGVLPTRTVMLHVPTAGGGHSKFVVQLPTDQVLEQRRKWFLNLKNDGQRLAFLHDSDPLVKPYVHHWWAQQAGGDAKKNAALAKLK